MTTSIGDHYAYCKHPECAGCLPTDDELKGWTILNLWGEMLSRCIHQTPETKTRDGALKALIDDGPEYRKRSSEIREKIFAD